ncbi:hypothetical protein H4S03_003112 [Coemansia sp. S3946]|nr:hypothetical protein H4S03_003112 [Coemansia sp. S3946]
MLESEVKSLGEALLRPLPPAVSTADLARDVAATHTETFDSTRRSSHWQVLLDKIGEIRAASPTTVLDKEAQKTVYQRSC